MWLKESILSSGDDGNVDDRSPPLSSAVDTI